MFSKLLIAAKADAINNPKPFNYSDPVKGNALKQKWIFGLGWNVVDDNGLAYNKYFDVSGTWNYLYYPTRISVQKNSNKRIITEGIFNYNKYKFVDKMLSIK